jgi:hypothetical protein
MNLRAVIALFLLAGSGMAAPQSPWAYGPESKAESKTRQFIVFGPAGASTPLNQAMRTQSKDVLRLDRFTTAISAERVKSALLKELGIPDRFERLAAPRPLEPGRTTIVLSGLNREPIQVGRLPVPGGWTYRLDLPLQMTAHRFNDVLLQVLLVDLTNPDDATAIDLPLWLSAGLLAHLEESAIEPLFLDSGLSGRIDSRGETLESRATRQFRSVFQTRSALSFDDLSWPRAVTDDEAGLFAPSAQFFVYQLLQFEDGRACLRAMIEKLSRYRNWQFAFYDAFSAHFKEPKDVEKWWALQVAALSGRDPSKLWPVSLSLERIQETLRVPVQIQASRSQLPESSAVTLQTAVAQWDYTREQMALRRAANDLGSLRRQVAVETVDLVDAYREAIARYLDSRDPLQQMSRNKAGTAPNALYEQRSFRRRLDELDAKRATMLKSALSDLALQEAERRVAATNALHRAEQPVARNR